MNSKLYYQQLCNEIPDIPIFSKDWWLDAVCGKSNWDVVLVQKKGRIQGSLPYYIQNKWGFRFLTMPPFTQTLGPWIEKRNTIHLHSQLEYEREIMTDLIDSLPFYHYFHQRFHYSFQNWLPFYWKNFQQTTRYTYVIDSLDDLDGVFKRFSHAKRKNINRAKKTVMVQFDLPARDFYENHKRTLQKQNQRIHYSYELFEKIHNACIKNNSAKTIYAIDSSGMIHSALFLIWYAESAYVLISTIDPEYRNSGSVSLLIWEALQYLAGKTLRFDFEGSMIQSVERSFHQFGTVQKPYFSIYKSNSFLVSLTKLIRDSRKRP